MKKSVMVFLCVLLCMFAFSAGLCAAEPTPWDGKADTSWYNTTDKVFEINTPQQLAGFAQIVNGNATGIKKDNFNGKTVKLTADLDLGGVKAADGTWSGQVWMPIGKNYSNSFYGTFLGNGHKISNFYADSEKGGYYSSALFAYARENARIEGIFLESGYVYSAKTSNGYTAGIVSNNYGLILNCHNGADIDSVMSAGGIAHYNTGAIVRCSNSGKLTSRFDKVTGVGVGGICYQHGGWMIADCYNTGDFDAKVAGGIAVQTSAQGKSWDPTFVNSYNAGEVVNAEKDAVLSGILYTKSGEKTPRITNSYYLNKGGVTDNYGGQAMDETTLKGAAATLSSSFVADTAGVNKGYPVLKWEQTGEFEPDELEGLKLNDATVENGKIVVTLNKLLLYTRLSAGDFTIEAKLGPKGSAGETVKLSTSLATSTDAEKNVTVATFTFTEIVEASVEQILAVNVSLKGCEAVSAQTTLPASSLWQAYAADSFAGGDGTYKKPYEIATAEQLALIAAGVNDGKDQFAGKYFVQTADIDLAGTELREAGLTWVPIGTRSKPFLGNYNGQNYKIKNMTAEPTSYMNGSGLFGATGNTTTTSDSAVQLINIVMENAKIDFKSGYYCGALVGIATATELRNCHVLSGMVSSNQYIGGLVGWFKGSASDVATYRISGCSANVDVTGLTVGGFVGQVGYDNGMNGSILIEDCFYIGNVDRTTSLVMTTGLGGFIGECTKLNTAMVQHCYTVATIKAQDNATIGGFIGGAGFSGSNYAPKDMRIEHNVVLNPAMSGLNTNDGYQYGRVAGLSKKTPEDIVSTFKNNYVLSTMTIDGQAYTGAEGDNACGTTKTPEVLAKQATWEEIGFDFSENGLWKWDVSLGRPVLSKDAVSYQISINEQPKNATAYMNKDAVFYVSANRGMGELSYAWQYSADDGKTWKAIKNDDNDATLEIAARLRMDGNLIRCKVTDEAKNIAYSDAAVLTVLGSDYDVSVAAQDLYRYYAQDMITTVRVPTSIYSYAGELTNFEILLQYYDAYGIANKGYGRGLSAWAIIDYIAQGGDPSVYYKSGGSVDGSEEADLIQDALDLQNALGTGAFFKSNGTNDGIMSNITYTLALDMYYNGAAEWGNENEEGTTGRTAAFNYLLTRLKDDTKTDGRYYESLTSCNGDYNAPLALRSNAEFVLLMARFADDSALGKQARAAMQDVLEMLDWQYENGKMDTSAEATARYASAVVAAMQCTESNTLKLEYQSRLDELFIKLSHARAKDGSYSASLTLATPAFTGDEQSTAAVMMAFGDMVNGKACLAEMSSLRSDSEAASADLSMITLPEIVLQDLDLPAEGTFGSEITWSSSAPNIIANDGKVTRPAVDTYVTMTATATYGEASVSRDFMVTVSAAREAGGDEAYADVQNIKLCTETLRDIELPTAGANGSVITWASSNESVIATDGKVTRPAIGQPDTLVTLTATATHSGVSQSRDFTVKVWASVDTTTNEGMVKEGYYVTREHYLSEETTTLKGYWDVWAAYAALGDELWERDYYYDTTTNSASQPGAQLLGVIALGENPYNYNGVNYVKQLEKAGFMGSYAVPVYNVLAADACGMKVNATTLSGARSSGCSWLTNLSMGPDTGGWACVIARKEVNSDAEYYKNVKIFLDAAAKDMVGNSSGSAALSKGCVVTGLTVFLAEGVTVEGIKGMDPTKDSPWIEQHPIKDIYGALMDGVNLGSFTTQPMMEICDLYNTLYNNGNVGWVACGVSKARMEGQIAKAEEIIANASKYEAASVEAVKKALEVAKGVSEERLTAKYVDFGEEYYGLYDAVRHAKLAGQSAMDQADADKVVEQINGLNEEITLADKDAVAAAAAAYEALTGEQKSLVGDEAKAKLEAAQKAIADLEQAEADKAAAAEVVNAINKINDNVTLDDQSAVAAARAAYDALTDAQKAYVTNLDQLTKAEGTIKELLEKANGKIKDMTDVAKGDWYYDDVAYALDNGLFKGITETLFGPNETMTRGMFVTVLGRNVGVEDATPSYPVMSVFDDVDGSQYYASHVKWAVEKGITVGVSKTEFMPEAKISRQDMATMMLRYAKAMGIELPAATGEVFTDDSNIAAYAKDAVYRMKAAGVLNGREHGEFDPMGDTTRAEVAAVLHRFLTYNYADYQKADDSGCVVVSVEKGTLGQGFLMEPILVKVEDGDTAADVTLRAAEQAGIGVRATQNSSYGFYLSAFADKAADVQIPQYILDVMTEEGLELQDRQETEWLGEFDYSYKSGWIYWVNHEHMNVTAGATEVKAGDVIRWQFTICGLGLDLGAQIGSMTPYVTVANKDALLHAMAVASKNQKDGEAYANAKALIRKMDASQAEVDAATAALK